MADITTEINPSITVKVDGMPDTKLDYKMKVEWISTAVNIGDLFKYLENKMSVRESEFICSICGKKDKRVIENEWDNLTFKSGWNSNPNKPAVENLQVGLIWTCSEKCKVFYTLQKTI